MTLELMAENGAQYRWDKDTISVLPGTYAVGDYRVESDWSGASYWYVMALLEEHARVRLSFLKNDSLQGDSALVNIFHGLGLVSELSVLYPLAAVIGILSNIAGPAHQAMIADLLPQEQRAEGYGVLRVMVNLAWIIGPTIGGIVANRSYFALFLIDAIISLLVAILFYFLISETKPEISPGKESENLLVTFQGYGRVLRNLAFLAFVLTSILMGLVYVQMYNSMSVYMRDVHGLQPQSYGLMMSTSAVTVIFLQFWITRRTKTRPPFLMMAAGALFYMVGFGMFGFDPLPGVLNLISIGGISLSLQGNLIWFMLAMVIITLGEMIVMPVSQALAAGFADEETRGRYLAVFSMGMAVPSAVGPLLAGLILDSPTLNPDLLWYLGALLCLIAASGFIVLQTKLGGNQRFAHAPLRKGPAPESSPSR
jgi:MFS family permease